jgi:hypothetical protein
MSTFVTTQWVHIEHQRVQTWLREHRLSQDLTLNPRGGK